MQRCCAIRALLLCAGLAWWATANASMATPHPCADGADTASAPNDARLLVTAEREINAGRDRYFHDLLQYILEHTEDSFGACTLEYTSNPHVRLPALMGTEDFRGVDVFWGETSRERETQLLPVRIPLTKGLATYRLLLIRPEDQARFSDIETFNDFGSLRVGGDPRWPISRAFQAQGFDIVSARNFESRFRMLQAGRFDFLVRNASEVLAELDAYKDMNIVLERDLVFVYLAPYYFFVDPRFPQLAERLATGLEAMHASGAFDARFFAYPTIRDALAQLNLNQRRPILIPHPDMPDQTPYQTRNYWHLPTRGVHPWEFDDEVVDDL